MQPNFKDFEQTKTYLFDQVPNFQKSGEKDLHLKLQTITQMMEHLGNPHEKFKSIHIAGTNGKGSTAHILASVLQEAGYQTGLTTSPHFLSPTERIRINGASISEADFCAFFEENYAIFHPLKPSFFEWMIAMAFDYFAKKEVDIAVVEVGLGGRLDATNIIQPLVSVITTIDFDHQNILGNTLQQIAAEKAGIIKNKTEVVIGDRNPDLKPVFEGIAHAKSAPILWVEEEPKTPFISDLEGDFQQKNLATAKQVVEVLNEKDFSISAEHFTEGIQKITPQTGLLGRWQTLNDIPLVIADNGHNVQAFRNITQKLSRLNVGAKRMILGFLQEKDLGEILKMLPLDGVYYFVELDTPRSMKITDIQTKIPEKLCATFYEKPEQAIEKALSESSEEDFIFIGGSTYTVEKALIYFQDNQ